MDFSFPPSHLPHIYDIGYDSAILLFNGRHRSRNSPETRRHTLSSERTPRCPQRRSVSSHLRHSPWRSPPRKGQSYSRQRSRSNSNYRSPSPVRRRMHSPFRHSSPSFRQRRTPSPVRRRRSPSPGRRHRSPSPARRRRSPSAWRRRSPVIRHMSPSPLRRRSPSWNSQSPISADAYVAEHQKDCYLRIMSPLALCCLYREIGIQGLHTINHKIHDPCLGSLQFDRYLLKHEIGPTVNIEEKDSAAKFHLLEFSPKRGAGHLASEYHGYDDNIDRSKKGGEIKCNESSGKRDETPAQQKSPMTKESFSHERARESYGIAIKKPDDKDHSHSNHAKDTDLLGKSDTTQSLARKVACVNQSDSIVSGSEESGKHRMEGKDRRKHKNFERKFVTSEEDYSDDFELENRKEAKRRKREERELRKEEKRQRRNDRQLRREERRAEKLKTKIKSDVYISGVDEAERIDYHLSDNEETLLEQKKLEIELRNKALESLIAKRGMNH
ncbi:hypothetical protein RIF29_27829 [Crotalaria pallida]|uniref:Uncharacterized protein n=1 Tax=Crotalaria pallida TaxID=3830 RepID=A0AAN9ERZ2_CROPI